MCPPIPGFSRDDVMSNPKRLGRPELAREWTPRFAAAPADASGAEEQAGAPSRGRAAFFCVFAAALAPFIFIFAITLRTHRRRGNG